MQNNGACKFSFKNSGVLFSESDRRGMHSFPHASHVHAILSGYRALCPLSDAPPPLVGNGASAGLLKGLAPAGLQSSKNKLNS